MHGIATDQLPRWPEHQQPVEPPRRGRAHHAVLALLLSILILAGGGAGAAIARGLETSGRLPYVSSQVALRPAPQASSATASGGAIDPASVAARVSPAIVDINTVLAGGGQAAGTGMILTSTGQVLTNHHVVQGATSISVTIAGRSSSYSAHVLGIDRSADVALVQVEGVSGLPTVSVADSSSLRVGQPVVAIGNALGRGGSPAVTQGSVTALDRSITASDGGGSEQLAGLVQIDASISPGDSGGALANSAGQVVAMITAGATQGRRQTSTTVGFAIPSNSAASVVNQVRAGEASATVVLGQPGYLGVQVTAVDPASAAQLGLGNASGALVAGVVAGSPADGTGLRPGAVITAVNGSAVESPDALGPMIQANKPGRRIQLTWIDQGGSHTTGITLGSGPAA